MKKLPDPIRDAHAIIVTLKACGREWEADIVDQLLDLLTEADGHIEFLGSVRDQAEERAIARLAEIRALEPDAMRYRLLREKAGDDYLVLKWVDDTTREELWGVGLDCALDAELPEPAEPFAISAMERDALRYRAIRVPSEAVDEVITDLATSTIFEGHVFDAAIDAAMAKGGWGE
jgi:hypothetical protein